MVGHTMYYTYVDSPVGTFFLAGDGSALELASFERGHQRRGPAAGWTRDASRLAEAVEQVEQYFAGQRTRFELALAPAGTPFQLEVWRALQSIPFGETRSYVEVARAIDRPAASRAVGAANAANSLPLIVPCHRVIGADGSLTGFGGGIETKRWLLEFEGALPSGQQALF